MRITSKFPEGTNLASQAQSYAYAHNSNINKATEPVIVTDALEQESSYKEQGRKKGDDLKLHMLFKETKDGVVDSSDLPPSYSNE